MSDALAILRSNTPEHIVRFAESYSSHLDAAAAAESVGMPGQARALMSDRRTLTYMQALSGHLRETYAAIRHETIGMLVSLATYDPARALSPGGGWIPFAQWPTELRMSVTDIEFTEEGDLKKVRFSKRLDAIGMLLDLTGDRVAQVAESRQMVVFESQD